MGKRADLTGQKFGKLTVMEKYGHDSNNKTLYRCECECGENMVVALGNNLQQGTTRSCGCIRKETMANVGRVFGGRADKFEGTRISSLKTRTSKRNKSGVKGVSFCNKTNKWVAQIYFQGTGHSLGYHDTIEEAAKARAAGEVKYFEPVLQKFNDTINCEV